jgi:putative transposase
MERTDETKIIKILQEAEGDITVRDICRKHQITEQTFYRWRNKYGGMEASEARRLKELEKENNQLKQIVADLTLDNRILRDVNQKKW